MAFFSRLSDIITCSLSELLAGSSHPIETARQIIGEMQQGVAGAQRSVNAASNTVQRLETEIQESRNGAEHWTQRAKSELLTGNEEAARTALLRRKEIYDLAAGLEQQRTAAVLTRDQLMTTWRAIEARLAEAQRMLCHLEAGGSPARGDAGESGLSTPTAHVDRQLASEVDAELAALKREISESSRQT